MLRIPDASHFVQEDAYEVVVPEVIELVGRNQHVARDDRRRPLQLPRVMHAPDGSVMTAAWAPLTPMTEPEADDLEVRVPEGGPQFHTD